MYLPEYGHEFKYLEEANYNSKVRFLQVMFILFGDMYNGALYTLLTC